MCTIGVFDAGQVRSTGGTDSAATVYVGLVRVSCTIVARRRTADAVTANIGDAVVTFGAGPTIFTGKTPLAGTHER